MLSHALMNYSRSVFFNKTGFSNFWFHVLAQEKLYSLMIIQGARRWPVFRQKGHFSESRSIDGYPPTHEASSGYIYIQELNSHAIGYALDRSVALSWPPGYRWD